MNLQQREIDIKHTLEKVDLGMAKIAPLVTKHLIEEFERTGISPVFSKDGNITGLKIVEAGIATPLVGSEEWQDIGSAIKNNNCLLEDFWFLEYDQTQYKCDKTHSIAGKLWVVSKKTGKSREYQIGNGSDFPENLIQDIKNNFFQ